MTEAVFIPAYVVAVALSAAALVRHFHDPERRRAGLAAFVWTASSAARTDIAGDLHAVMLFALDGALVLFLIALAWRARFGWPVLAAFVQTIGAAALLASMIDARLVGELHMSVSAVAAHLTAAVLLAGAWLQGERQPARARIAVRARPASVSAVIDAQGRA